MCHRNRQSIYDRVDDRPGLHHHQNATGKAYHQCRYRCTCESLRDNLSDFLRSIAHDDRSDNSHDQEQCGNLCKIPPLGFHTPDEDDDHDQEINQNQYLADAEFLLLYIVIRRMILVQKRSINYTLGRILLYFQCIPHDHSGTDNQHNDMTDNAESCPGHIRHLCDTLRHTHRERVHGCPGKSNACAEGYHGQAYHSIKAHADKDACENRYKRQPLFKHAHG